VTNRDDALRRQLNWTGPEKSDDEPDTGQAAPPPATSPAPSRPLVDGVPLDAAPPQVQQQASPQPGTAPSPIGFREPIRSRGSFRESSGFGPSPPQAPTRDTRQQWRQPQGWQPPGAPGLSPQAVGAPSPPTAHPPYPGPPTQPWPAPLVGRDGRVAAPPPPTDWSYTDRIRVADLVPQRRTPPGRGWRRLVYRATFGLVNPGRSAEELRQAELEAKIKGALRGHYKIGVMGKGGVGKTTVSASVGSVFAELRQDDRVVAVDADTAFGKLGTRIDPKAIGSYWDLAADQHLETFADVRNRVGNNAAGLFVLVGESTPARRRVLDPAVYREATSRLDRHFTISIIDCSSTMDAPVTQEVLRDLDALIVVSSPWVDGAAAAGQTMDWLANRGLTGLLQRTVIVLNDSDGHADKRTRSILAQQFTGHGQTVIEVPFDGQLRPGGVIDATSGMAPQTRLRFVEIAAALAEHFPR
jgi:MinD-like ATPase involved in chromosome partitioning or flagellar assembly